MKEVFSGFKGLEKVGPLILEQEPLLKPPLEAPSEAPLKSLEKSSFSSLQVQPRSLGQESFNCRFSTVSEAAAETTCSLVVVV